ncbi:MAG: 3-dehydroquinate synthase [Faecousia sp.]
MNTVRVTASSTYEVKIGSGLLAELGQETRAVTKGSVLVVTDETVAPRYLAKVYQSLTAAGLRVHTASVPAGERTKCVEYYVNLLNILAAKQLTRTDAAIALGGGVVGDLTGFAAATYLRGIPLIQVPTTLLAMVDSSVGGKTAIDLPAGKNLVGAFHQPSLVLCDPDALNTLPAATFRDGCAEVIKTAILFDPQLFAHLRERGTDFDREYVITRCVECKRDVVCADEFDKGERQKLNLGHTIGHAIEQCSHFTVSHGQAVAIGTAMMARAFYRNPEEIESVLHTFGLPTETDFSAEALANAALSDKKRAGDTLTLVVPRAIGGCTLEKIPVTELQPIIEAGMRHG